ncbi:MAG: glycoside hydrolase family 16 protein [Aestuariivirga sp.]
MRGKLLFEDNFKSGKLVGDKWLQLYLPHWTSAELARPRFRFEDGKLVLLIDSDQQPWCPEHDGEVKCSSIQTGHYAGPIGSADGQLRFNPALRVKTALPSSQLFVPLHGYFEVRARASLNSNNMVAFWMLGFENIRENSGEITVMEIFGRNCTNEGTRFGHGVKHLNDQRLQTEYHEDMLPFKVDDWHVYAAEWSAHGVTHYLDDKPLRHIAMAPQYPLQFMLGIYELPNEPQPAVIQPATFTIGYVRGYSLN